MPRTLPPVMTPKMLADYWLCSERHVRNLITSGKLGYFRLGGKLIRIKAEHVEAYEQQTTARAEDLVPDEIQSADPKPQKKPAPRLDRDPVLRARLASLRKPR